METTERLPGAPVTLTLKSIRTSKMFLEFLRIGVGVIWFTNLVFIVDPANRYWSTFSAVALTFAPTTIGGPGFAQYVSAHPLFFSWVVAIVTAYLAVGLTFGITTRIVCFVGSAFSAVLLATQWGSTFFFPGGTDVGEHPLYILIYGTLVVGGAGASLSVDSYLRDRWEIWAARRRTAPAATPRRAPFGSTWTAPVPAQTVFVYFIAATVLALAIGFGLVIAVPASPSSSSGTTPLNPVATVNLTIDLNNTTGWPYYTPANFTVPTGLIEFNIVDNDQPSNWSACPCHVGGTIGGVEYINGSAVGLVQGNVAHTFNIPILGLQVLSPGNSTVQFYLEVDHPGIYTWYCFAPCGAGADPYNTPPMGVAGMMTGTMTAT